MTTYPSYSEQQRITDNEDRQAWRDWRRAEACVYFGAKQWGLTILALWATDHWLKPIADWLVGVVAIIILTVHFMVAKRVDARMEAPAKS